MTSALRKPDGGYGWVISVSSGIIAGFSTSIGKCNGQIYMALLSESPFSRTEIASAVILPRALSSIVAIIGNKLAENYSFKATLFCGIFAIALGLGLSSLVVRDITLFMLTYGVIVGIGCGCSLTPCTIVTGLYFTRRRSIAIGLMTSLAGANAFFFPPLLQYLIDEYNLEGALLLWAGVTLHGCVAALLIRQPKCLKTDEEKRPALEEQIVDTPSPSKQSKPKSFITLIFYQLVSDCRHFRSSICILLLITRIVHYFNMMSVLLILPQFTREQLPNVTKNQCALLISSISVGDILSRWLSGWLMNAIPDYRRTSYVLAMLGISISTVCFQFARSYAAFLILSLVHGVFSGYVFVAYFVIMFDIYGVKNTAGVNALHFTITGFFSLAAGPTMAQIRNSFDSYVPCTTVLGTTCLVVCGLWLLNCLFKRNTPKFIH